MRALKEIESFVWQSYNDELKNRIMRPQNAGSFTSDISEDRYLAYGSEGEICDGNFFAIYILIDKEDHLIVDAKYQAFGQTPLIGAAEKACDVLIGKNIHQARRLNASLIETSFKKSSQKASFPKNCYEHINHVLSAIDSALEELPVELVGAVELSTPLETQTSSEGISYPEFFSLSKQEKLKIVQDVIDEDIAPYIALDDGGAEIKDIIGEKEVVLSYSGSCTTCYSAIGTTLTAIEKTLKDKIHPDIIVTPDMESLNF